MARKTSIRNISFNALSLETMLKLTLCRNESPFNIIVNVILLKKDKEQEEPCQTCKTRIVFIIYKRHTVIHCLRIVLGFKRYVNCKMIYCILWMSERCKRNRQVVSKNLTILKKTTFV